MGKRTKGESWPKPVSMKANLWEEAGAAETAKAKWE